MSLNYVDKANDNRLIPEPNAPDIRTQRMSLGTVSITPRATGTQTGARITNKDDTITVNDGSFNRIAIGRLPDGRYGIVVSKSGHDISEIFT